MTGRRSQSKGRRGEIELAEYLREHGVPDARPGSALNFGAEPDVVGLDGIHIECKRHERVEIARWYDQARADAARMRDGKPVVIFRQNRRPWLVTLSLDDFLAVVENTQKYTETAKSEV